MDIIPFQKLIRIMPKAIFAPGPEAVSACLISRWHTQAHTALSSYVSRIRIQKARLFEMKMESEWVVTGLTMKNTFAD